MSSEYDDRPLSDMAECSLGPVSKTSCNSSRKSPSDSQSNLAKRASEISKRVTFLLLKENSPSVEALSVAISPAPSQEMLKGVGEDEEEGGRSTLDKQVNRSHSSNLFPGDLEDTRILPGTL